MMSIDLDLQEEFKARLAERFMGYELVEILDIDVLDIIEAFLPRVLGSSLLLEEVGMLPEEEDDAVSD